MQVRTCCSERRFNDAVDDYCALLGLPAGLVENVTDGTNAFLVALEVDRGILVSEAEIVDAKQRNRISEVFLIDRPLSEEDRARLAAICRANECVRWLEERSKAVAAQSAACAIASRRQI